MTRTRPRGTGCASFGLSLGDAAVCTTELMRSTASRCARTAARRVRLSSSAAAEQAPVTITVTNDGIAVVKFDALGEKMNTLSAKLMASFDGVLTRLETDTSIRAAVLISGKPDNFIAGADIGMLVRWTGERRCWRWRGWPSGQQLAWAGGK